MIGKGRFNQAFMRRIAAQEMHRIGDAAIDMVAIAWKVLADLRRHQVDIVTIGQYLSPGPKHLPVDRFVIPEQFERFRRHGEQELGFLQVVSSPLTRSSYHAGEVQRLMAQHPR